jgi:hypothetical protein
LSSQGVFSGRGKEERLKLTSGDLTGYGKASDSSPWNGTLLRKILWNEHAGKTQLTRPKHSWMLKWLFKKQNRWKRTGFTGTGTSSKLL